MLNQHSLEEIAEIHRLLEDIKKEMNNIKYKPFIDDFYIECLVARQKPLDNSYVEELIEKTASPLQYLEHSLHGWVAFIILPLFAFANAGINLSGVGLEQISHSVPIGIALGLFVGKQVGVFAFCWLAIKLKLTALPQGMSWGTLYGTAILCGIGFTMSLFIGSLAFEETEVNLIFDDRLGILVGSFISGIVGYIVLRLSLPAKQKG